MNVSHGRVLHLTDHRGKAPVVTTQPHMYILLHTHTHNTFDQGELEGGHAHKNLYFLIPLEMPYTNIFKGKEKG